MKRALFDLSKLDFPHYKPLANGILAILLLNINSRVLKVLRDDSYSQSQRELQDFG